MLALHNPGCALGTNSSILLYKAAQLLFDKYSLGV